MLYLYLVAIPEDYILIDQKIFGNEVCGQFEDYKGWGLQKHPW